MDGMVREGPRILWLRILRRYFYSARGAGWWLRRWGCGGPEGEAASVVENDVRGSIAALVAGDSGGDAGGYGGGVDGLPVVGDDVPLNGDEIEFAGGAEDVGAAGSVGWAEVADMGAQGSSRAALQSVSSCRMRAAEWKGSQGWVMVWLPMRCPAAAISRTRAGHWRAKLPIRKKVAWTWWRARISRRWGVAAGLGPSS